MQLYTVWDSVHKPRVHGRFAGPRLALQARRPDPAPQPWPRHLRVSVLGELLLPGLGAARRLLRLEADLPQLLHHLLVLLIFHGVQAAVVAVIQQLLLSECVPGALHGPVLGMLGWLKHGAATFQALLPGALGCGLPSRSVAGRRDRGLELLWARQLRLVAL